MTAVANATFTAAQFNTHVRDNLNETAPAKASAANQLFVSTGSNAIAARTPTTADVSTSQATTNSAFVDLATSGPAVTVTTGTKAIVLIASGLAQNTVGSYATAGYAISSATTLAAGSDRAVQLRAGAVNQQILVGTCVLEEGLTAGSNVFTMKYTVGAAGGTATFFSRRITVIPL